MYIYYSAYEYFSKHFNTGMAYKMFANRFPYNNISTHNVHILGKPKDHTGLSTLTKSIHVILSNYLLWNLKEANTATSKKNIRQGLLALDMPGFIFS